MARIPTRPVSQWPKKQIERYAYSAIVRDTFNEDKEVQAEADAAFHRWYHRQMDRQELKRWAGMELEWRWLNE